MCFHLKGLIQAGNKSAAAVFPEALQIIPDFIQCY